MGNLLISVLNLIFPPSCIGCGGNNSVVCGTCASKISWMGVSTCIVCVKPSLRGFTHQQCLNAYTPERLLSTLSYEGVVRKAIVGSKYGPKNFHALEFLTEFVMPTLLETGFALGRESAVVPVPLTRRKFGQRGFNQSEVIAGVLSRRLGLKYEDLLMRISGDTSQRGLSKEQRKANVEGVFTCRAEKVRGKDIILVDDVCTTGATFLSAAKTLKEGGARFIWCFALAKA